MNKLCVHCWLLPNRTQQQHQQQESRQRQQTGPTTRTGGLLLNLKLHTFYFCSSSHSILVLWILPSSVSSWLGNFSIPRYSVGCSPPVRYFAWDFDFYSGFVISNICTIRRPSAGNPEDVAVLLVGQEQKPKYWSNDIELSNCTRMSPWRVCSTRGTPCPVVDVILCTL